MKRVIIANDEVGKYKITFINRLKDVGEEHYTNINDVVSRLEKFVHPKQYFIIDRMIKQDKGTTNGRIASTSAFEVYKGEYQMTDYTSF